MQPEMVAQPDRHLPAVLPDEAAAAFRDVLRRRRSVRMLNYRRVDEVAIE
jgi:hypothetical protein